MSSLASESKRVYAKVRVLVAGGEGAPTVRQLAGILGMSPRECFRAAKWLEDKGALEILDKDSRGFSCKSKADYRLRLKDAA